MVEIGDRVPHVILEGVDGKIINPAHFSGQKLVLYFYPKDDTPGCTREAKDFSSLADDFEKAGTWVVGISRDEAAKHRKFIEKHDLRVSLVTDPDGKACEAFGVWAEKNMYGRKYMGIERATFLIDRDGVVKGVWRQVKVPGHAEAVLQAARELT